MHNCVSTVDLCSQHLLWNYYVLVAGSTGTRYFASACLSGFAFDADSTDRVRIQANDVNQFYSVSIHKISHYAHLDYKSTPGSITFIMFRLTLVALVLSCAVAFAPATVRAVSRISQCRSYVPFSRVSKRNDSVLLWMQYLWRLSNLFA
jgi:hypothetical protein